MRLESHDHSGAAGFFCVGLRLFDEGLVTAMDAIKNTDGQVDRPGQRPERPEIVEDLHADQTPRRRETSGRLMMRAFT